jgi:hypothetical protein
MRRKIREPKHIAEVIDKASSVNLKNFLEFYKVSSAWPELAGRVSSRSRPVSLLKGKLKIVADSPSVAQEIMMMSGRIISEALSKGVKIESVLVNIGRVEPIVESRSLNEGNRHRFKPILRGYSTDDIERVKNRFNQKGLPKDVLDGLCRLYIAYNRRFNSLK